MDTQTQIDNLIELAIVQRAELKQLVEQLPQLREHLTSEIEKTFEAVEPELRQELEEFFARKTEERVDLLRGEVSERVSEMLKSLEIAAAAKYSALMNERAKNAELLAQAEQRIAEAAATIPGKVKEIVTDELSRFPRAGEIDQLRKEFAEPKSLNPRGKWSPNETYQKLDLVTYNGESYISNIDNNREKPSRSSPVWTLSAARGGGGGSGFTTLAELTATPTAGQLLIGTNGQWTNNTLTAGAGITITNAPGSITIDATTAQETLTATVTNAESVAITKGQVVYVFGATGNRPSVKLAYNTSDATSAKTFGVVSDTSISAGGVGTVTCVGVVSGLNLGAYNDGDTVYLSATPGAFTATKPYAPNHLVYVGIIERANAGNGELYVRIQNGYELDEIHDVQIVTPTNGQVLGYDSATSLWKNSSTATLNALTINGVTKYTSNTIGAAADVWTGPSGDGGLFLNVPTTESIYLGINNSPQLTLAPSLATFGGAVQTGGYARINGLIAGTNTYLQLWNGASTIGLLGSRAAIDGGASADVGLYVYGANNLTLWTNSSVVATFASSGATTLAGSLTAGGTTISLLDTTSANTRIFSHKKTAPALNHIAQLVLAQGTGDGFGANDRTYQLTNTGASSTATNFILQYWNGSTYSERLKIDSAGATTLGGSLSVGTDLAVVGKTSFGFASSSRGTATLDANYGLVLRGYTAAVADLTLTQDGGTIFMRNAVGTSNVFFNGLVKVGMTGTIDSRLHVYESTAADVSNGITIEQASTGDAVTSYLLTGVQRWSVGIDNSDSDKFKIGTGTLGAADRFTLDISGNSTIAGTLTHGELHVANGLAGHSRSIYALSGVGKVEIGYGPNGYGFAHATGSYIAYSDGLYFGLPGAVAATLTLSTTGGLTASDDYVRTGAAGTYRVYVARTGANARWAWGSDSTAESGSNAGSDFRIYSFNDAGNVLTNPVLQLTRSTGAATFASSLTANGASITSSGTNAVVQSTDGAVITKVQSILSSTIGIVGTQSNHDLGIYTNNTNRLNISAAGVVVIPGTSSSNNTSSGALVVGNGTSGGLGVGGAINAGGLIKSTNTSQANDTSAVYFQATAGNDATLGGLIVTIGARPSATESNRYAYIGAGDNGAMRPISLNDNGAGAYGQVLVRSTTNSTDKTTGALVIGDGTNGGLGVSGGIYAGSTINSGSSFTSSFGTGGVGTQLILNNTATNATIGRGSAIVYTGTGGANLAAIESQTATASNNTGLLILKTASGGTLTAAATYDQNGNLIQKVTGTAPTMNVNSSMTFELTSNTTLKILVRGTDGTTRSASLTLA